MRSRRKGTPRARPAIRMPAVQSEAPNSTLRALTQPVTVMTVRKGISKISAKVNAIALPERSVRQAQSHALGLSELKHRRAGGDVFDRQPDRLEEADVRWLAASSRTGHDLAQGMNPSPAELTFAFRQQEVTRLEAGGLDIIGHHDVRAANGGPVDLPAIGKVRAAHVQVLAGLQPLAGNDGMRRPGDGGDDVGPLERLPHAPGGADARRARYGAREGLDEGMAVRRVTAEHPHLAKRADGRDRQHLGDGLAARTDDREDRRLGASQVPGGESGRRARS